MHNISKEEETEVPIGLSVAPLSVDTHTPGPCTSGCSSYIIHKPKKKYTWKITLIYRNKNRKFLKCVILEPQHQITCHVNLAFTDQKSVSVNSWLMNILNKQNKKAASYL